MPKVFISYRRDDSAYPAQAIYSKLADHYGAESVMFDVDAIPFGVDLVEYLNQQVSECDVLLAVIGDAWLDVPSPDGGRRLDNPRDFVRIEIQAALRREIPAIPVLVGKASMPGADQLPRGLKSLSRRNAAEVRAGRDFETHLERFVRGIEVSLKHVSRPPERATPSEIVPSKQPSGEGPRDEPKREPIPPAEPVTDAVTNSISLQLKLIEPDTFMMGEGKEQHLVILTEPFKLGVYPVTQAEYQRVIQTNPSTFKGDDRRPVEKVSWFDAIAFCNRLSEQEGLSPYYDVQGEEVTIRGGEGYRLPTEAEWEYACRAGNQGAYCFGDDENQLHDYAWFDKNSEGKTHPVGQKKPNAWGLYDMHGNVWEWCWDWYDEYDTEPVSDPSGPKQGALRVSRGGSWYFQAERCRSAHRCRFGPRNRSLNLGFRVARSSVQ